MPDLIGHRCADHRIDPATETLIIGTFNPHITENKADFFYGRPRNHLWKILPDVLGGPSLKGECKNRKLAFIRDKRIDFIDLISGVEGQPSDYSDKWLDKCERIHWRQDIIAEVEKLRFLKRVCISRKHFKDVPKIGEKANELANYFRDKPIAFSYVHTPARAFSRAIVEWRAFLGSEPPQKGNVGLS